MADRYNLLGPRPAGEPAPKVPTLENRDSFLPTFALGFACAALLCSLIHG